MNSYFQLIINKDKNKCESNEFGTEVRDRTEVQMGGATASGWNRGF